jgi:hypothetical protein
MFKKLMTLVLVLAIASAASATVNWTNGWGDGQWNQGLNWDTGSIPTITDRTNLANFAMTSVSVTVGSGDSVAAGKTQARFHSQIDLTIDGTLQIDGSAEFYGCTSSTITVNGTLNALTKTATTVASGKLGGQNGGTTSLIVNGTANFSDGAGGGSLSVGYRASGTTNVTIGSSGLLTADLMTIRDDDTIAGDEVNITINQGGQIIVHSDIYDRAWAALTSGQLVGVGGQISITYDGTDTVIEVPEPATIAMLGLGGLLLRKKR